MLAVAALALLVDVHLLLGTPPADVVAILPFVALLAVAGLAGAFVLVFIRLAEAVPAFYLWAVVTGAAILGTLLDLSGGLDRGTIVGAILVATVMGSLLGAGAGVVGSRSREGEGQRAGVRVPRLAVFALTAGVALAAASTAWLVWDGPETGTEMSGPAPGFVQRGKGRAALPDPANPGPYAIQKLAYGSGLDRHWLSSSEKVALHADPVDGSAFLGGWSGVPGWARSRYWGFDEENLPRRAHVYSPEGPGPFPLVLVAHGNWMAESPSDQGYSYLARLVSSRGFIVVSVDETFLNFSFVDLLGPSAGLRKHHLARAFLLLEHLRLWREWNGEVGNPFQGRVDMDRIGLIGHSAGGEAVALAAALNRLQRHPEDARIPLAYGFPIRAVVAIAPETDVYRPGGRLTTLRNLSYLVIQGSYDGNGFRGSQQYERVRFEGRGDWFKAALYAGRANHRQFNSLWGRDDLLGLENGFLNRGPLLTEEEQQQILRVYVSAFLEATLNDERRYRALFRGRSRPASLPDVSYFQQYEDASTRSFADFEEDIDATTATLPGAAINGHNLTYWREMPVLLKAGALGTRAVFLAWRSRSEGEPGRFEITLPKGEVLDVDGELTFRLAQSEATGRTLDLTVELTDERSRRARLPLSHIAPVAAPLQTRYLKPPAGRESGSEIVFQAYDLRLSDFAEASPGFDPRRLSRVAFVFDQTGAGSIILDDVGYRGSGEAAVDGGELPGVLDEQPTGDRVATRSGYTEPSAEEGNE